MGVSEGVSRRTVGFGVVAGLVVSQANWALFDDLINRQASFDAVGWGNWFLYLLVPIVAGGVLLYYGRTPPSDERTPERALAASVAALIGASGVLRILVPFLLHRGDVIAARVPRTLADGFSFVAQYGRLAPLAGQGDRFALVTAVVAAAVIAAAVAFGALAFAPKLEPILASAVAGAVLAGIGWYVPGGAGARIIGALWPVVFLGTIGLVLAVFDARARPAASRILVR